MDSMAMPRDWQTMRSLANDPIHVPIYLSTGAQLCKAIPKGKVSTYGALAVILGSCARATGQVTTNIQIVIGHIKI